MYCSDWVVLRLHDDTINEPNSKCRDHTHTNPSSYAIVHSFVPNHFNSNQIRAARTQPLIKKFSRRRTPTRGSRASQLRPKCNVRASPQITAFLIAVSPEGKCMRRWERGEEEKE
ncbi:hypothetical protein WR25_25059 [Diploscapter pachys]|uniref:Uncharacterized protein n=1 Tax=Diploscapter pachys TaxID=2018661 RepID=A0A2A2LSX7_9BILA|nr:hypothetical protein WR25_25059 [Diploscapter pachys]